MVVFWIIAKSKKVADDINSSGGQAIAVSGDILNDQYINELVRKTAEFGNGKIHIVVNNAGYTWDGVIHKVLPYQRQQAFKKSTAD
jgi:3-oxoacyl-[acyl-carrier protein] reductase